MDELAMVLGDLMHDGQADWMMSVPGLAAEYRPISSEEIILAATDELCLVTVGGGIRIELKADVKIQAWESLSKSPRQWLHGLYLTLPKSAAAMAERKRITCLGPDNSALLANDRGRMIFDLGLNVPHLDICLRSDNADFVAAMKMLDGQILNWRDQNFLNLLLDSQPARVFMSRLGRIEIYQDIPPPNGRTPAGSHTHFLPKLRVKNNSANNSAFLSDDDDAILQVTPPHPTLDRMANPQTFNRAAHEAFQELLFRFGDPDYCAAKSERIAALEASRQKGNFPPAQQPAGLAVAIAARQFAARGQMR